MTVGLKMLINLSEIGGVWPSKWIVFYPHLVVSYGRMHIMKDTAWTFKIIVACLERGDGLAAT
jgi:hypothetical protein